MGFAIALLLKGAAGGLVADLLINLLLQEKKALHLKVGFRKNN
jgi:hypothetical protein|tara:strand:+ start:3856 stop:3984 length:129 start_codon:yes stop_codon:yes gene_type:complete